MSMEYPCVYFEKDGKCRKFSDDTAISYCVMGPCPEQKLSNADRIRAMSDEELAVFLESSRGCPSDDDCEYGVHATPENCIKHWTTWLQQPAEEDT